MAEILWGGDIAQSIRQRADSGEEIAAAGAWVQRTLEADSGSGSHLCWSRQLERISPKLFGSMGIDQREFS